MEKNVQNKAQTIGKRIRNITLVLVFVLAANQLVFWAILPVFFLHVATDRKAIAELETDSTISELAIQNGDTIQYGWQTGPDSDLVVLYFGGSNADTATWLNDAIDNGWAQSAADVKLLMLDYPAFGKNSGSVSEQKVFETADCLYRYAEEAYPNAKIVALGYSIGTAAALYLGTQHDLDGMILVAPMYDGTSIYTPNDSLFHAILEPLASIQMQNDDFARQCKVYTLLIAGDADRMTPLNETQDLAELFLQDPEICVISGCAHGEYWKQEKTYAAIGNYLNACRQGDSR